MEFVLGVGVGIWGTIAAYFAGRRWEDVRWYVYRRRHPTPKMRVMKGRLLKKVEPPPFAVPEETP